MLQRVVRLLGNTVDRRSIVIVAAPEQQLPSLPAELTVTRDQRPGRGPLEGIAAGLMALESDVEAAYVTSCDVPLLVPAFAERMFSLLEDLLPFTAVTFTCEREQVHPLAAVYRASILPAVQRLLNADRLRPRFLFDEVRTRLVTPGELRSVDPDLQTLVNLNTAEDYRAALQAAGFPENRP